MYVEWNLTKMLRKATNVKWWEHRTNAEVYEELPLLGNKIAARRMKLAGHCHRHPELAASDLVLWQPNQKLRRSVVAHVGVQALIPASHLKSHVLQIF